MCGKKVLDTKNYKQTSVWWCADQTVMYASDTGGACSSPSSSDFSVFYLYAPTFTDESLLFPTFCKTEYFPLILYDNAAATVAINREAVSTRALIITCLLAFVYFRFYALKCLFFEVISVCNISHLSELKCSMEGHLTGFFLCLYLRPCFKFFNRQYTHICLTTLVTDKPYHSQFVS